MIAGENVEAVADANRNQAAEVMLPNVDAVDAGEHLIDDGIAEPAENVNEYRAALLPLPLAAAAVVDMDIVDAIKAEEDEEPVIDDENLNENDQEPGIGHGELNEIEQVKLEPIVNELSVEQMMELDDMLVDNMPADPLGGTSSENSDSNDNSDAAMPGCSYVHPQLGMNRNAIALDTADGSEDSSDYEDAVGETKSNQIIWETVDEDVLIELKSSYPVQPFDDPNFDLLKQEDDVISGNIQFRDEVCVSKIRKIKKWKNKMTSTQMIHIFSNSQARGRVYRIGNGFVVMPVKVVSSLSRWNSGTFRGLGIFDR